MNGLRIHGDCAHPRHDPNDACAGGARYSVQDLGACWPGWGNNPDLLPSCAMGCTGCQSDGSANSCGLPPGGGMPLMEGCCVDDGPGQDPMGPGGCRTCDTSKGC
mgnify:CR=1 FL=1